MPAPFHPPEAPPPGAGRAAEDRFLRRSFRHHSRTFSLAARLLPRPVRLPVATVYLYCRTVDSVADGVSRTAGAERARTEIDRMGACLGMSLAGDPPLGGPDETLWRRLAEVHATYGLDGHALRQQLDGARWDLDGRPIATHADLLAYSDLVAGSVGAVVLPFLVRDRADAAALDAPARALGAAMQLTNILRDVGEDWRDLGRVYLPLDALAGAGLTPNALVPGLLDVPDLRARYAAIVEGVMAEAERLYALADAGIRDLHPAAQAGVRAAARMYREILNEVRAARYDNLSRRAVVPLRRKLRGAVLDGYAGRRARLAPP
ncbi:MAG TPA: squalene/phytoene synthase family protein [Rubricoccaceae bacterium]